MRTLFNLLLAIIVVSCPLRCQLGWGDCCGSEQLVVQSDSQCCCDVGNTETETPTEPVLPEKECKCICAGATMPDASDFSPSDVSELLKGSLATRIQTIWSISTRPLNSHLQSRVSFLPCDSARNVGRALRELQGSLVI